MPNGMYRFVELMEDIDEAYACTYMTCTHFSGLYDSAQSAERDARQMLPWLRSSDLHCSNGS